MNVLVVGGTGFIGQNLCVELHDRGHDVTALSRDPGDAELPDGVDSVAGDVTAYDSIEGAFEGQDTVVNLVALSPLFKPRGGAGHEKVHLGGTENVVDAAEEHGVDRVVQMSALGADPDGSTAYLRTKGQAEQVVRDAPLDWVIVRPSVVFGEGGEFVGFTKMLTTPYVTGLPGGGKTRFQPIWVGDLAPMLADCAIDEDRAGEVYEIGGPEVLTLADVTRLAYRAEGKSVRVLPVPMALAKIGLTAAGPLPFVPMGPDQARSLRIDNTVVENDVTAFDVDPDDLTTLSEYLGLSG
ncbi:complex I NDUFA9 subunit family protein [Natronoarchaeum mannanilyticum]|uniref:Complex I NDUFA9 subunit family protein n=1 Tax=Natronoarchaeum mannanilyticum TaxID=926360 RepID=A0AAV3TA55_9EURY